MEKCIINCKFYFIVTTLLRRVQCQSNLKLEANINIKLLKANVGTSLILKHSCVDNIKTFEKLLFQSNTGNY